MVATVGTTFIPSPGAQRGFNPGNARTNPNLNTLCGRSLLCFVLHEKQTNRTTLQYGCLRTGTWTVGMHNCLPRTIGSVGVERMVDEPLVSNE